MMRTTKTFGLVAYAVMCSWSWTRPLNLYVDAFSVLPTTHKVSSTRQSSVLYTSWIPEDASKDGVDRRTLLGRSITSGGLGLLLSTMLDASSAGAFVPYTTVSNNSLDDFLSDLSSTSSATTTTSSPNTKLSSPTIPKSVGGAGKWPDAPSPLPTSVKSAAELTAISEESSSLSEFEQSLIKSATAGSGRTISPTSHGY